MNSLRRNLTVSLTGILVAVFTALWILLTVAITRVAQDQLLMHLEHDGNAVIAALTRDARGALTVTAAGVEDVYRKPQSGHYYLVRDGRGRLLASASLGSATFNLPALAPGRRQADNIEGPAGQSVLLLTRGVTVFDEHVEVAVGEDLSSMQSETREQSLLVLAFIVPLFVAAVLLQRYMIGRALQPLGQLRQALERVGRHEVTRIDARAPDEVRPLVDEVNRLLVLVNRRLIQARTSVGNLAHALKTPLAVLFNLSDAPELPASTRALLREQTGMMRERLERELVRARLAGGEQVGGVFNPRAELEVMTRVLHSLHRERQLQIDVLAPDRNLPHDREDLLELIGNLAENACKWARGRVLLEVTEPGERHLTRIRVADDGPGCSPEDLARLTARGLRLDEATPGHGLGLSICKDIAAFYGGVISFGNDPELGGLAVTVELPVKPA